MNKPKILSATAAPRDSRDSFAILIALITHPISIGTLGLLTVVMTSVADWQMRIFYLVSLVVLTFIPAALYLFVLFRGNVFEVLELINREARLMPYTLMIFGAIIAVTILMAIDAPKPIFIMTLVLLANEVVLGTINFWTKVSVHTATATFTALTLGYLINPAWYGLIFLVPLIGWARVHRHRHTLKQVITGTLIAAIVTSLVIIIGSKVF